MRSRLFFLFLILTAILFFAYTDSFKAPFQYDDLRGIAFNSQISHFDPLHIFIAYPSRALTQMTFSLNLLFNGFNPFWYHVVNLIIHILNGALFFLLLVKITRGNIKLSLLASAFFLLHPVNVESVTYISGRAGLLSAFFLLSGILCFLKIESSAVKFSKWEAFSLLLFALSCFSKESGFAFPFFLAVYFFSKETQDYGSLKKYFPFAGLWILLLISYFYYNAEIFSGRDTHSLSKHITTHINASTKYLKLLLFPVNLNIDHYFLLKGFPGIKTFFAILLISAVLYIVFSRKDSTQSKFFTGWYFVSFMPVVLVPINDIVSERWLYLASMSFSFLIAKFFLITLKSVKSDRIRVLIAEVLMVALIAAFLFNVQKRNSLWIDNVALWQDAVKKSPLKARPLINLGTGLLEKSQMNDAAACFRKSVSIDGSSLQPYLNLGLIYVLQGRYDEAFRAFKKAETIGPEDPYLHNSFGNFYRDIGNLQKAVFEYKKVISINPAFADAHGNLGIIYRRMGKDEEAEKELIKAAGFDAFRSKWKNELALFYIGKRKFNEAEIIIDELTASFPEKADVRNTRGIYFGETGRTSASEKEFSKAFTLAPSNMNYLVNKALALKKMGKLDDALNCLILADRHTPGMPDIIFHTGVILFMGKRFDSAEHYFKRVSVMLPFFSDVWKYLGNIESLRGNREKALNYYSLSIKYEMMNNRGTVE